jgi:hypothetical protein
MSKNIVKKVPDLDLDFKYLLVVHHRGLSRLWYMRILIIRPSSTTSHGFFARSPIVMEGYPMFF